MSLRIKREAVDVGSNVLQVDPEPAEGLRLPWEFLFVVDHVDDRRPVRPYPPAGMHLEMTVNEGQSSASARYPPAKWSQPIRNRTGWPSL